MLGKCCNAVNNCDLGAGDDLNMVRVSSFVHANTEIAQKCFRGTHTHAHTRRRRIKSDRADWAWRAGGMSILFGAVAAEEQSLVVDSCACMYWYGIVLRVV